MINFVTGPVELETDIDRWLFALKHLTEFKTRPAYLSCPQFDQLFNLAKYANLTLVLHHIRETSLSFLDLEFFKATLKVNHDFAFNLLLFYADELQESEKKMRNLALMTIKGRLAVALLHLKEQFGLNVHI